MKNINSFNSEQNIEINSKIYKYFDIKKVANEFNLNLLKIPISLKIILENLLRNEDGETLSKDIIASIFQSLKDRNNKNAIEISFFLQEC